MPQTKKTYWKAPGERDQEFADSAQDEFLESPLSQDQGAALNRRSFLKIAGFSFAGGALTVACTHGPVKKAIPYLIQPEEVTPGRAYWYATTCGACSAACGVLTKNRDGRPIKLEGNPDHPLSRGGLCAVGQASILGLYDSQRLKGPLASGKSATWDAVDASIQGELDRLRANGGAVRILTGTLSGPTVKSSIASFLSGFREGRWVAYDPLSASAIPDAHQRSHGLRVLPRYRFDRSDVIVAFEADFLGTWISPVEHTAGYSVGRALPRMSWHAQFESRMSLTGSKADLRVAISPVRIANEMCLLAERLAEKAGMPAPATEYKPVSEQAIEEAATRLWDARGRGIVVCGVNSVEAQLLANFMNHLLGNYGATLDIEAPSRQKLGSDGDLAALIADMNAGRISALLVHGVNPAYDLPASAGFIDAAKKVGLVVSFAEREDETASLARFVCPDHHFLESWSDAEPVAGLVSITQPAIRPLGQTRAFIESLARWSGMDQGEYEILRESWQKAVFPRQTAETSFDVFWNRAVERGVSQVSPEPAPAAIFNSAAVPSRILTEEVAKGELGLILYPKVGLLDGRGAHNPWLQELPDPISKIAWDNYASFSPAAARILGIAEGDVVSIALQGESIELPAQIQPGQHDGTVAIALGYGRKGTDRFSKIGPQWLFGKPTVEEGRLVGINASPFLSLKDGVLHYARSGVKVAKTGKKYELAATQIHHSLTVPAALATGKNEPRPIVQETTLAEWRRNPASGAHEDGERASLWPEDHPATGAKWDMVIDLSACTGCAACVIACQAENNVPVVGKDEVRRRREMHWIRIDRYYAERGSGGVDVVHQPMTCQQCGNAPCESVCPVLATVHSAEGLNQQIYNRCVGTRYCANNCPYKVRRFNWFDYAHADRLQNMVLNPDVTIRTRGVMEKCTFCVQRIQEAKSEAKRKGVAIADGDIQPACQQSCPAKAITFGDGNNAKSAVSLKARDPRHYGVLTELNVNPSVGYLRVVRNREEETHEHRG